MTLVHLDLWLSAPPDESTPPSQDARVRVEEHNRADAHTVHALHSHHDRALLEQLRASHVEPFESLFFQHAAALRRFTYAIVHSAEVAEDIVQEVFAQLWERRETVEIKTSLRAYLYAAARGRALTALRSASVRANYAARAAHTIADDMIVVPANPPDALAGLEREELTRALRDALAQLPSRTRQAAELRWFAKLSHAEIAAVMGTALPTVNNQLTTALKALRERLRPYMD